MDNVAAIRDALGDDWLPILYASKIRSQRTRKVTLDIAKRENKPEIQHTLLGIELKVGRKRFACPDLATARYLQVFARLGCSEFAVPYDISRLPALADELETAWQTAVVLIKNKKADANRSKLIKTMRDEINIIGPGETMPLFNRETKQRK